MGFWNLLGNPGTQRAGKNRRLPSSRGLNLGQAAESKDLDSGSTGRIFGWSDLHADFEPNFLAIRRLSRTDYLNDTLLIAGEVSHDFDRLKSTLGLLKARFKHVFFVPGGQDLWVKRPGRNSVDRFFEILDHCRQNGIHCEPRAIGNTWIHPIFSWHQDAFAPAPAPGSQAWLDSWMGYFRCRWPGTIESASDFLMAMNRPWKKPRGISKVITLSHFVPRRDLLASTAFLPSSVSSFRRDPEPSQPLTMIPGMALMAGDFRIDKLLREIGSQIHVYGAHHSHSDLTFQGVRYLRAPLAYPMERAGKTSALFETPFEINRLNSMPMDRDLGPSGDLLSPS